MVARWENKFLARGTRVACFYQSKGLTDSYRLIHPDSDDRFSWFDYRSKGFEREPKRGLRIDLIYDLPSPHRASDRCQYDYEARAMERPSDHCPIWTELK